MVRHCLPLRFVPQTWRATHGKGPACAVPGSAAGRCLACPPPSTCAAATGARRSAPDHPSLVLTHPAPARPRRYHSFCAWTMANPTPQALIVLDARADARFADLPLISRGDIGFYAGTPLIASNGHRLGTL